MADHLVDFVPDIMAPKTVEDENDSQDLAPNMPQNYRIAARSGASQDTSIVSGAVFSYQGETSLRSHDADVSVLGGTMDTDENSSFMGSITSATRSIFSRSPTGGASRARASHPWERGGGDPLSTSNRLEQFARRPWGNGSAIGSSVNTDLDPESNARDSFALKRNCSTDSLDLSTRSTQSRTQYLTTTARLKGKTAHSAGFTFATADPAQLLKRRPRSHSPPPIEMYSATGMLASMLGFTSESDSETKYYRDSSDDDMSKKPATFTSLFRLQEEEVEEDFEHHRIKEGIELSRKNNKPKRKTSYEVDNPRTSTMVARPDVDANRISAVGEGWRRAKIGQELEEHSDSGSHGDTSIDILDQLLHRELLEDLPERSVHIKQESIASLESSLSRLDADFEKMDSSQVIREEAEEQLNNLDHAEAVINTFNQILEHEEKAQLRLEIAMTESLPSLNSLGSMLEDLPSDYDENANLALREFVADFMDTMDHTLNHPPQAKLTDLFRWSTKKNVDQVERTRLKRIEQEAAKNNGRSISSADALFQRVGKNAVIADDMSDGGDGDRSHLTGGGWMKMGGAMVKINNEGCTRRKSLDAQASPALQDQPKVNSKMTEGIEVRKAEREKEVNASEFFPLEMKSTEPEAKPFARRPERQSEPPVTTKRNASVKSGTRSKPNSIPVQEERSSSMELTSVLNSNSAVRTTSKREGSLKYGTNGKNRPESDAIIERGAVLKDRTSETPLGPLSRAREGVQLENTAASLFVPADGGTTSTEVLDRHKPRRIREDTQLENVPASIARNDCERCNFESGRLKTYEGESKQREKMLARLIKTDISTKGLERHESKSARPSADTGEYRRRKNTLAVITSTEQGAIATKCLDRHELDPIKPRIRKGEDKRRGNISASIVASDEGAVLAKGLERHKSEPVRPRPRTQAAEGSRRNGVKRHGKGASSSSSENSFVAAANSSLRPINSSSRGKDLDDAKKPALRKGAKMVNGAKGSATGSHRRSRRGPEVAPHKLKPDLVTAFKKSSSSVRRADVESRGTEPVASSIVKDKESKNEIKEEASLSISPEEVLAALMSSTLSKALEAKTKTGGLRSMVDTETSIPSPSAQSLDRITKKRRGKTRLENTTSLKSRASTMSSRENSPPHAAISALVTTPREIKASTEHRPSKRSGGVRQSTSLNRELLSASRASRVSSRDSNASHAAVSPSTTIYRYEEVLVEPRASQRVNKVKQSTSAEREVSVKSRGTRASSSTVKATSADISLAHRSCRKINGVRQSTSADREVSSESRTSRVSLRGDRRSHPAVLLTNTSSAEALVQPQAAQRTNDVTRPVTSTVEDAAQLPVPPTKRSSRDRSGGARQSATITISPTQAASAELPQRKLSKLKASSTNDVTPTDARILNSHASSSAIPSQKVKSAISSDSKEILSGSKANSNQQHRSSKSGASITLAKPSSRLSQSVHDGSGRSRRFMMEKGSDDDDSIDISEPVFRKAPSRPRRSSTKFIQATPTSPGTKTTTASTETGERKTGETVGSIPSRISPAEHRSAEKKTRSRRKRSLPSSTILSASVKKAAATQSSNRKSRGRR